MKATADAVLEAARDAVLDAALPLAAGQGWTQAVLDEAVAAAAIDAPLAARAFARGPADLVRAFGDRIDRDMTVALAREDLSKVRVGDRVKLAITLRFAGMAPHREAVRAAVGFCALPAHATVGARGVAASADAIWRALDDPSTDFSFYTKRATLAAVLAATTLVWLEDESGDAWPGFLDRRLADLARVRKMRVRAGDAVARARREVSVRFRRGFPAGLPGLAGIRSAFFRSPRR